MNDYSPVVPQRLLNRYLVRSIRTPDKVLFNKIRFRCSLRQATEVLNSEPSRIRCH